MPAGWYPDPETGASRYWDGEAWTERTPGPDGPAAEAPPATRAPEAAKKKGGLESLAVGPRVLTYLIAAIVVGAFVYYVLLGGETPRQ